MFDEIRNQLLKEYKEKDFLTGGCYLYARIIKAVYGGEIYINRILEHCVICYHGKLYDIHGCIKDISGFHPINPHEIAMCEKQYIFKNPKTDRKIYEKYTEMFSASSV